MSVGLRYTAILVVAMLAWSSLGPAAGMKLCVASRSHIAVESAEAGPCVPSGVHDSNEHLLIQSECATCDSHGCFDLPLGTGLAYTTAKQKVEKTSPVPIPGAFSQCLPAAEAAHDSKPVHHESRCSKMDALLTIRLLI